MISRFEQNGQPLDRIRPRNASRQMLADPELEQLDGYGENLLDIGQTYDPLNYYDPYNPGSSPLDMLPRWRVNRDGLEWVQDDEKDEADKKLATIALRGILVAYRTYRVRRVSPRYNPNEPNPIICTSHDMVQGHGDPGGRCGERVCPFARRPTDEERERYGKTEADCRERTRLFFVDDQNALPFVIEVPGYWQKTWEKELNRITGQRGAASWQVVSEMTLVPKGNGAMLKFRLLGYWDASNEDTVNALMTLRGNISLMVEQFTQAIVSGMGDSEGGITVDEPVDDFRDHWVEEPAPRPAVVAAPEPEPIADRPMTAMERLRQRNQSRM